MVPTTASASLQAESTFPATATVSTSTSAALPAEAALAAGSTATLPALRRRPDHCTAHRRGRRMNRAAGWRPRRVHASARVRPRCIHASAGLRRLRADVALRSRRTYAAIEPAMRHRWTHIAITAECPAAHCTGRRLSDLRMPASRRDAAGAEPRFGTMHPAV